MLGCLFFVSGQNVFVSLTERKIGAAGGDWKELNPHWPFLHFFCSLVQRFVCFCFLYADPILRANSGDYKTITGTNTDKTRTFGDIMYSANNRGRAG